MTHINPINTTPEEPFAVGESDFAFFHNYAYHCESGAFILCRNGSATVSVNQYQGKITVDTMIIMLPNSVLMLTDRTEDFQVTYFSFSNDLFSEASFRMPPAFFHDLRQYPVLYPPAQEVEGIMLWFRAMSHTYQDRENMFRNTIVRNRLQNVLLETLDKMQRFVTNRKSAAVTTTRQTELFHKFVGLVHGNCRKEREVGFYADKLCISTRYLSTIVRNTVHSSAKEFIDRSVILEIKMLLRSSDFSVQEIAYRLNFPDQSYLGRFFKKHTGESPTEYRNAKN